MTDDLREKVAQAIYEAMARRNEFGDAWPWSTTPEAQRDEFLDDADAAIEAIESERARMVGKPECDDCGIANALRADLAALRARSSGSAAQTCRINFGYEGSVRICSLPEGHDGDHEGPLRGSLAADRVFARWPMSDDRDEHKRLISECCTCEKCGHIQAEPNWCHECGHRTSMPDWAKPLVDAFYEREELRDELECPWGPSATCKWGNACADCDRP